MRTASQESCSSEKLPDSFYLPARQAINLSKFRYSQKLSFMKPILIAAFTAAIIFPSKNFAQTTDDKLTAISKEMFENGNSNFVIVDAIKDGLIKPGESYTVMYAADQFTIEGKALTDATIKTYKERIAAFYEKTGQGITFVRMTSDGTKMETILDPASSFRKQKELTLEDVDKQHHKGFTANTKKISEALITDKLISTEDGYKFEYNAKGFFVNGKKLKGAAAKKYIALSKESMEGHSGSFRESVSGKKFDGK